MVAGLANGQWRVSQTFIHLFDSQSCLCPPSKKKKSVKIQKDSTIFLEM